MYSLDLPYEVYKGVPYGETTVVCPSVIVVVSKTHRCLCKVLYEVTNFSSRFFFLGGGGGRRQILES